MKIIFRLKETSIDSLGRMLRSVLSYKHDYSCSRKVMGHNKNHFILFHMFTK